VYQSEIAHPDIRGTLTACIQFFLGIGALCSNWIAYGCYTGLSGNARWRIPLGVQIVPAAALGFFIMFFPESPRIPLTFISHMQAGYSTTVNLKEQLKPLRNSTRTETKRTQLSLDKWMRLKRLVLTKVASLRNHGDNCSRIRVLSAGWYWG
jgi:MFS family permease